MKKKVLYTCEHCGTDYEDKDKASRCEKSHLLDLEIIDKTYLAIGDDTGDESEPLNFPSRIVLRSVEHSRKSAIYVLYTDCDNFYK